MSRRTAWIVSLVVAAATGFWVSGPYFYETFIGLDATAFPAGPLLERIGHVLLPNVGFSAAGLLFSLLLVLPAAAIAFLLVRGARRAATDRSRRPRPGSASRSVARSSAGATGAAAGGAPAPRSSAARS